MLTRLTILAALLVEPGASVLAASSAQRTAPKASAVRVATECSDGSESRSSGRGTCSHHGGEAERDHS